MWWWWWNRRRTWWVQPQPSSPGCSWEAGAAFCSEQLQTASGHWWEFQCRSGRTCRRLGACRSLGPPCSIAGIRRDFWRCQFCWTSGCRSFFPPCHWARIRHPKPSLVSLWVGDFADRSAKSFRVVNANPTLVVNADVDVLYLLGVIPTLAKLDYRRIVRKWPAQIWWIIDFKKAPQGNDLRVKCLSSAWYTAYISW